MKTKGNLKNLFTLSFFLFTFTLLGQTIPEMDITSEGIILPRYTKADKATLPSQEGRVLYNMTDGVLAYQNDSGWYTVASTAKVLELIEQRFQPYVSLEGDRLYLAPGQFIVVPGISAAQCRVTDIDGNIYNCVTINGKTWMTENLKTETYTDGTPIPYGGAVTSLSPPDDYFFFLDDDPINKNINGLLYTHGAVNNNNHDLCPTGWHPAYKSDWEDLETFIGSDGWSGQQAKALKAQFAGWQSDPPFYVPADVYGLAVLPSMYYNAGPLQPTTARFWARNLGTLSTNNGAAIIFSWNDDTLNITEQFRTIGQSVRCVQN